MKFAFSKKNSLLGKIIKWWDRGPYEHVECILQENADGTYTIASSEPGVGVRTLTNQTLPASDWDIIEVASADLAAAKGWFIAHNGESYYYLGLFGFVVRPAVGGSKDEWFCSEACMTAAFNIPQSWRYSPNAMYDVLSRMK
jgi:hypothetical protein